MYGLGSVPCMTPDQVRAAIARAKAAAAVWKASPFAQRRALMRTLLRYTVDHQDDIVRVACRDSGKAPVDAAFGEVMTTCEKLAWLISEGERWLAPEPRSAGRMMFYKAARVEYHPVGVVGAIVPWNYPFHNVLNPLSAALFAGNGLVVKVSEHAAWSSGFYGRIIDAALAAVGAPAGLVQIVTGCADAGAALVSGGVGHLIFVGSDAVGRKVMESAAPTLTPLTLELGGKDPFIVCDDADLDAAVAAGLRGTFQSCGQNCAGAERFLVQERVVDEFARRAATAARKMVQGPPLSPAGVDCGAMCMPGAAEKVASLVNDAVAKGAKVLAGGRVGGGPGQFYEPTVLVGVQRGMDIWAEEAFGPVLCITSFTSDADAIALANDCAFGLGSAVFSRSARRARAIGAALEAGMTSINDFATTYMCQSLPFGGVKASGFGRFGGVEGLRGLTVVKAVAEDRWPALVSTVIPPVLRYPLGPASFPFVRGLIRLFYAPSWVGALQGLPDVLKGAIGGPGAWTIPTTPTTPAMPGPPKKRE
jgi:acyl-CoA reductase-like NAD-dependent aldehyde dehydrogenase